MIPRVIHQAHAGSSLPAPARGLVRSWAERNGPAWAVRLYGPEAALAFVRREFPEYYEPFSGMPSDAERAAFFRCASFSIDTTNALVAAHWLLLLLLLCWVSDACCITAVPRSAVAPGGYARLQHSWRHDWWRTRLPVFSAASCCDPLLLLLLLYVGLWCCCALAAHMLTWTSSAVRHWTISLPLLTRFWLVGMILGQQARAVQQQRRCVWHRGFLQPHRVILCCVGCAKTLHMA